MTAWCPACCWWAATRASGRGRSRPQNRRTGPPISTPRSRTRPGRSSSMRPQPNNASRVLSKAIAAGKHVYSEKPVAPTAAQGLALLREADARGRKHGAVEDKVHLPGLQKLAALIRRGDLGRIVGFRLEFGWWVFDGSDRPCPAAELELPRGRRRTDPRHVSALALRDRDDRRPDCCGLPRPNGSPPPSASTSGACAIRVDGRGFRHDHGRARGRCVRHHSEFVGHARAPRRSAHAAGGRHQGLGCRRSASMSRAVRRADPGHRPFQRHERHRR